MHLFRLFTPTFATLLLAFAVAGCSDTPPTDPGEGIVDVSMEGIADQVHLPAGFKIEHLYSPSEHDQGSWVCMTTDDKGNLITSDQYGYLYRVILPQGEEKAVKVEKLPLEIGHAQGMLWAFNSLYVMVNSYEGIEGRSSGLYRITDSDNNGELDKIQLLKTLKGDGEHGPHALRLGPDGKTLFAMSGNHTDVPENFSSIQPSAWKDDRIFPVIKDARGHAANREAPGGWIAMTDSVGSFWKIFSSGYRNSFDMGFDARGELLVFDSDMEWDLGMPWYRPIRICHATSGSEFGWRTGSGKWPEYYPDNLPPVVNIGQGSPTGVVMGTGAAFPARYQEGLFAFDWSFGTMYFVSWKVEGGSYSGQKEEFLSGVPLPLTDGVIGPDGALYFATGGRRTDSHVFRVSYVGEESTEPVQPDLSLSDAFILRKKIESFHQNPTTESMNLAWENLSHKDRFVRFSARILLEQFSPELWKDKLLKETQLQTILEASLSAARLAPESWKEDIFTLLSKQKQDAIPQELKQSYLRAVGLAVSRWGNPGETTRQALVSSLAPEFPSKDPFISRELLPLLIALGDETVVAKAVAYLNGEALSTEDQTSLISQEITTRSEQYGPQIADMLKNMPPAQAISVAQSLSYAEKGWTRELREKYFLWFQEAMKKSGGYNYRGFMDILRQNALAKVPKEESEFIAQITGSIAGDPANVLANLPQPEGPGKNWNIGEVGHLFREADKKPKNYERGAKIYQAALCASCHTMRGAGNNIGPDLTQAGTRFSGGNIIEAIMLPSDVISDQYATTLFSLNNGKTIAGRILDENKTQVVVSTNPYSTQTQTIALADIKSRELSKISLMPPGLINRLNGDEIIDLIAYIQAGADPKHEVYKGK
ncbi:MAG: c-type cytochrome [Bacteroidia bacterium]|nr:c-type cytochrome [Bacteroidia bacterium]